ncbi:MAG: flagellar hook-length control protein FliK [Desulfuromonas thiophila]|nr:flagellar hook-length control protein FliK [Desulfuromonas thiophila]
MQTAAILPQLATTAAPARTLGSDSRAFAPAMEQASSAIGQKGQRASDSGSDLAGAVNAQAEKVPSATSASASGTETAPAEAAAAPEMAPASETVHLSTTIDAAQALVVENPVQLPASDLATDTSETIAPQELLPPVASQKPAIELAARTAEIQPMATGVVAQPALPKTSAAPNLAPQTDGYAPTAQPEVSTATTQPMATSNAVQQQATATTVATLNRPAQADGHTPKIERISHLDGELQTQNPLPESAPLDDMPWQKQLQQSEPLQGFIARTSTNNSESLASSKTSRPRIDDPRFTSLLAPQQTPSLRQQTGENPSVMAVPAPATSPIGPTESPADGKLTATTSTPSANQAFDNSLLTMSQSDSGITGTELANPADRQNPSAVASTLQTGPAAAPTTEGDSLLLRDGSQLPASRVITQTIEHLSVHARGDSSVVTVKLHPEELGELQLRLVMEGDQLRVQLQTQHQQVQDVLERNFPRLRDALQDQGLTIEDFQVSLDNGQNPQRDFGASSDRQWQGRGFQQVTSDEPENVPTVIAVQALSGRNASGSLSLRV